MLILGGIHLKKEKDIMDVAIELIPAMEKVYIFLQHQGKLAHPLIKRGDLGQIVKFLCTFLVIILLAIYLWCQIC